MNMAIIASNFFYRRVLEYMIGLIDRQEHKWNDNTDSFMRDKASSNYELIAVNIKWSKTWREV